MPRINKAARGKPQARKGGHHHSGKGVRHLIRPLKLPPDLMKLVKK